MKKILTLQTGIVFLIAILIAGACGPADNSDQSSDTKKKRGWHRVKIYCKAVEDNGAVKFEMHNADDDKKVIATPSKDDHKKLVADLETVVIPKTKVTWIWASDSDIKKFVRIGPQTPGQIIPGDAYRVFLTRKLRLKVPIEAEPGEESYVIEFKDMNGNPVAVDPYLKIR